MSETHSGGCLCGGVQYAVTGPLRDVVNCHQRPLKRLTDEIDNLSRYVDQRSQEKLAAIKNLVIEKDRLDFAHVYLGLTKGWLFVHVPVTYALIALTVLHVLVVYAFSSGTW
jgi:hypothetical protein